jgi:hypothetical protein
MLGAALLVAALAARPDWVDGMPAAFPRDRFLVAVGEAEDRTTAEARARAGVAAFFESRVAAVSRARESEGRERVARTEEVGGVAVEARAELRVASFAAQQEVTSVTAKLLEGVEIGDAWTDPAGRSHALAVLDRARAVEVLRRRLGEVDGEVAAQAARLQERAPALERARIAHRLVAASARRAPLAQDLRILDPAAEPAAPAALAEARAAAERALAAVAVGVRASGDDAERLRTAAVRAVVGTGMRVVPVDAATDLAVAVDEEAAPPAEGGGWVVVRLTARVRALDARKETALSFVETAKGTSGRPDEAARRAGEALAARVEERLGEELRARLEAR